MKRILDVFTTGVKRTFLQLGAIAVATGLHATDGLELESQDMQAGGGYNKSIEGMAMQYAEAECRSTKGKLRASGYTDGAAHNHLPFYLHKELTDALGHLGESESLSVDDRTSSNLRRPILKHCAA
jgi:hypothetical protein